MAQVFLTCSIEGLTITDGIPECSTGWVMEQPMFPMYELDPVELGELMAATAAFLIVCYVGRTLLGLFKPGNSGE